jgi:hypothetical protein
MSATPPSCMMTSTVVREGVHGLPVHQLREFHVRCTGVARTPAQPSALVWPGHVTGGAYNSASASRAFRSFVHARSVGIASQDHQVTNSAHHPTLAHGQARRNPTTSRRPCRHRRRRVPPDMYAVCTPVRYAITPRVSYAQSSHPSRVDHPRHDVQLPLSQAAPHSAPSSDARNRDVNDP